jgi:putative transposon-encoded protein
MSYEGDIFENPEKIKDSQIKNNIKVLKEIGYKFYIVEGTVEPLVYYSFLADKYKKNISESYHDYLIIRTDSLVVSDGGLNISWDELFSRIIFMDKYIEKEKTYKNNLEEIKRTRNDLLSIYFKGVDNTPIFDSNVIIDKEILKSYEKNIKLFGNNYSGKILKEYYNLLKKNKFIKNKNIESFWNKIFN